MPTQTDFSVSDQAGLAAAITAIDLTGADSAPDTTYTIDLPAGATIALSGVLPAVNLASGDTLIVNGGGAVLTGGGFARGLFVYAGTVVIADLTISDTTALGGSGGIGQSSGGGGGMGAGGGLFVAAGATVALTGVLFANNTAQGGAGGTDWGGNPIGGLAGGGGMIGFGGGLSTNALLVTQINGGGGLGGGGGNHNVTADPSAYAGIVPGIPQVESGHYSIGAGGGSGGAYTGGGIGASTRNGGFGGGGAATGTGGFGGGAGAAGASGGFGGGGGGNGNAAGFGGGAGQIGAPMRTLTGYNYSGYYPAPVYSTVPGPAVGGGGLGAGGNVFVQQGGVLAIGAGGLTGGTAIGGASSGGQSGAGLGSAVFLQGNELLLLDPPAGHTLTIAGSIADEAGSVPGVTGSGTIAVAGTGTVILSAASTYTGGTAIDGGTLLLANAQAAGSGTIFLAPAGGATLEIAGASPVNPIGDLKAGDAIRLDARPASVSYDAASHTLIYAGGALNFDPPSAPAAVVYDAMTGIVAIACFAAGTRIATPRGPVAVERLGVGEAVRLAEGGIAPVVWLGHRRVDCRRHAWPADVHPVRIAAHAFGVGRPRRDLWLSPDHAVFVDGVLIPVRYLLNDATVAQVPVARITYWHVELPAHGVLLAEGLPAESYLDSGNRAAFANGGAVVTAQPDFARQSWAAAGCAPLVTEGPERDAVYARLIAQALALGWRMADAGGGAVRWTAPGAARPVRRRSAHGARA